ncbi:hypothetical protein PR048_019636 [Dryococelus australis]|uniref:Uncharacterized protein n=1 Tax=Dryococelus australis TaxID=614101 RepID=A0ABQ9H403_9NEOP|nr:hypothetical protein PR048_019636 [Dryococelus australis]
MQRSRAAFFKARRTLLVNIHGLRGSGNISSATSSPDFTLALTQAHILPFHHDPCSITFLRSSGCRSLHLGPRWPHTLTRHDHAMSEGRFLKHSQLTQLFSHWLPLLRSPARPQTSAGMKFSYVGFSCGDRGGNCRGVGTFFTNLFRSLSVFIPPILTSFSYTGFCSRPYRRVYKEQVRQKYRVHERQGCLRDAYHTPGLFYARGRGGVVVRLLASHQGESESIPGGVAPRILARGNRAGRRRWSAGFSRESPVLPRPLHSGTAPYPSCFTLDGSEDPAAAQISPLHALYHLHPSSPHPLFGLASRAYATLPPANGKAPAASPRGHQDSTATTRVQSAFARVERGGRCRCPEGFLPFQHNVVALVPPVGRKTARWLLTCPRLHPSNAPDINFIWRFSLSLASPSEIHTGLNIGEQGFSESHLRKLSPQLGLYGTTFHPSLPTLLGACHSVRPIKYMLAEAGLERGGEMYDDATKTLRGPRELRKRDAQNTISVKLHTLNEEVQVNSRWRGTPHFNVSSTAGLSKTKPMTRKIRIGEINGQGLRPNTLSGVIWNKLWKSDRKEEEWLGREM